jgi:CHAT domain-containing protein
MRRRYVLDDFSVVYAPSLTLLDICAGQRTAAGQSERLPLAIDPSEDLHLSRVEVAWVPNAAGVRSEPLLGSHATRDRWRTAVAAARAAHYSGHGQYVWEDPLQSHLVLADGHLEVGDLFSKPVPLWAVRLISLSGCETGMPDPADLADEYISVAAGFMFLGAATVLSTLWVAEVLASAILFRDWYGALRTGARPSDALAGAQRRLRDMRAREVIGILKTTLREAERARDERMLDEVRKRISGLEANGGAFGHRRPFAHPVFWAGYTLNGIDSAPQLGAQ